MNKKIFHVICSLLLGLVLFAGQAHGQSVPFRHVVLVSIDGLMGDAISALGPEEAPAFYEIIHNGVTTLNARTDPDYTKTMPNHLSMVTGIFAAGDEGHNYTLNEETGRTFHEVKGRYVASLFDVIREHGLKSALFASKVKFHMFTKSYPIDQSHIDPASDEAVVDVFLKELTASRPAFVFLHVRTPDKIGHQISWNLTPGSRYLLAVKEMDLLVGKILAAIRADEDLAATTAIIITADHGGTMLGHNNPRDERNYTIPFLVWGEGLREGDLYVFNPSSRTDPGDAHIAGGAFRQPVRNGDAANLALSLLGLPPVSGSVINSRQDLNVLP